MSGNIVPPARAVLAVPGSSSRFLEKASSLGRDVAVMVDLEDGVAAGDRRAARMLVDGFVRAAGQDQAIWVRLNAAGTTDFALDAEIAAHWEIPLVLPMATLAGAEQAARALPHSRLIAMVETARGVEEAPQIAAHASVSGMMFGGLDFIAGIAAAGAVRFSDTSWAQSRVVNAAAASDLWVIAGPHPDIADAEGLAAEASREATAGFAGKLAIHPTQLAVIDATFRPSVEQRRWAKSVLVAVATDPAAGAVLRVEGRMVDSPVIQLARRIIEHAEAAQ